MKRILNSFAPLVLGFTFIASIASIGCAARYYDADHRDYHQWDRDEDRAYHVYWNENHSRDPYRNYGRLNPGEQREYWDWRHGHPDEGRAKGDRDRRRDRNDRDRDDRDRR